MFHGRQPLRLVRTFRADGRGLLLLTLAGGGFLTIGTQMIYPVLLPQLREVYGLDFTTSGLLLTILFFSNGLFQFPSGLVADAVGERSLMSASSFFCGVSIAIVIGFQSFTILLVATTFLGIGISAFTLSRISLLPKTFPDHVGAASGLTFGSADAGQAIIPAVAGLLAAAVGWRMGFAITVPFFALIGVASLYAIPTGLSELKSVRASLTQTNILPVLREFRRAEVVYGTAIIFLFAGMWMSFSGFFPEYLVRAKGLSVPRAGGLFGALFGLGMVVKPIAGTLFDRYGVRRTITGLVVVSSVGFVVLSQARQFHELLVATALVSLFLGTGTIGMSMILESLPDDVTGTGIGILRTGTFSVAAMGPVVVGVLADRNYFDEAILGLAVLPVLMFLVVLRFPTGTTR